MVPRFHSFPNKVSRLGVYTELIELLFFLSIALSSKNATIDFY